MSALREDTNLLAIAHVREALDRIEAAQIELMRACEELSPIVGGIPQWNAVSRLHDRVKAQWYRLNGWLEKKQNKLDLDGNNKVWRAEKRLGRSLTEAEIKQVLGLLKVVGG